MYLVGIFKAILLLWKVVFRVCGIDFPLYFIYSVIVCMYKRCCLVVPKGTEENIFRKRGWHRI